MSQEIEGRLKNLIFSKLVERGRHWEVEEQAEFALSLLIEYLANKALELTDNY